MPILTLTVACVVVLAFALVGRQFARRKAHLPHAKRIWILMTLGLACLVFSETFVLLMLMLDAQIALWVVALLGFSGPIIAAFLLMYSIVLRSIEESEY